MSLKMRINFRILAFGIAILLARNVVDLINALPLRHDGEGSASLAAVFILYLSMMAVSLHRVHKAQENRSSAA